MTRSAALLCAGLVLATACKRGAAESISPSDETQSAAAPAELLSKLSIIEGLFSSQQFPKALD